MNRNSHNSRGSSTHAGFRNPRWRTIFIALMLVLAIGSAGLTPSAQAAPSPQQGFGYRLSAFQFSAGGIICVGDIVRISVRVTRGFENQQNVQQVPGVNVRASNSNDSIGWYSPTQANTGYMAEAPGAIIFRFHAEKAGTTTLTFEGTINHTWFGLAMGTYTRSDQVKLTVEDCQYKVTVGSDFAVPDMFVGAVFKDALMTLNAQGLYEGTATVNWSGYWRDISGHCSEFLVPPPPSKATLTGVIDADKGLFHLLITYDAHNLAWSQDCEGPGHSDYSFEARATELKFNVPVNGAGKVEYQAMDSVPACCGISGKATITVVAEKAGSGQ